MQLTVIYSFLSQGIYLYHGTCRVWTSFLSMDLEIVHLVERFSSLQRCETFCTLNNRKTWGAVKWGMEEGCSVKGEEVWEFSSSGHWGSGFTQDQDSFKTLTQCSIAKNWFLRWDNELWFAFVKMEETSNTDPVWEMTQLSVPGTVANYFPLSEVGGCQRLHQSPLI